MARTVKRRKFQTVEGIRYLQCWECGQYKPASSQFFRKVRRRHDWLNRCFSCMQKEVLYRHRASVRRSNIEGLVYFLQCTADRNRYIPSGSIKIGFTTRLDERMKTLTFGDSHYQLLGVVDGSYSVERSLHRRFGKFNVDNEWFEPSAELLQYIQSNTGKCEVETVATNWLCEVSTNQLELWKSA